MIRIPEELQVIGVVTRLLLATLKEDEAMERTRRVGEVLTKGCEKLLPVFDM